jgi:hypothetical protein
MRARRTFGLPRPDRAVRFYPVRGAIGRFDDQRAGQKLMAALFPGLFFCFIRDKILLDCYRIQGL